MRKKDFSSMLRCVGITSENKQIIGGVYNLYETTGLPLDVILDCIHRKNAMVSWIDFYKEARSAGMKHGRILAKLKEAICDVWGLKFYEHVEDKLDLVFSDEKIHKERARNMCQLEEMTTDEPSFRESITIVAKPEPIKPDETIMINEDVSFPCTACGAHLNRPCRKLMPHKRLMSIAWEVSRAKFLPKEKSDVAMSAALKTTILYRPVGGLEYHLIRLSEYKRFPPGLVNQPIFYPVESEHCARKIAKEQDKENGNIGFVVRFKIRTGFINMHPLHTVGGGVLGQVHREYRIKASDMERLNWNIVGNIEVLHIFRAS